MAEQYLSEVGLMEIVNVSDTAQVQEVSKDSYSDTAIYETIKRSHGMEDLFFAALQTAIVGVGNKNFGEFKMNITSHDVEALYEKYGVKSDLQSAKLMPGDLTPSRLQRFYRLQIHQYLEDNADIMPRLWKKYSSLSPEFRSITFPGAEAMVSTKAEAEYLIETYKELDSRLGTNITERINRVLLARGIIQV